MGRCEERMQKGRPRARGLSTGVAIAFRRAASAPNRIVPALQAGRGRGAQVGRFRIPAALRMRPARTESSSDCTRGALTSQLESYARHAARV